MEIINVHEAKIHFSKLLARVHAGEEITIGKAGKPFAKLVPLSPAGERIPGIARGRSQTHFSNRCLNLKGSSRINVKITPEG